MSFRIAFFGSDAFSIPILNRLIQTYQVCGVITQPDKQTGRGKKIQISQVKQAGLDHGIPVIQPASLSREWLLPELEHMQPDLIIVAAYGKILPKWILDYPKFGCVNVHASLLPKWRGASPIQAVILHGEEITGNTIMLMDEGLDSGKILRQRETPVRKDDTYGSLSQRLSRMGAELLIETLEDYLKGKITPIPQDDKAATYCGLIKKEAGSLDFSQEAEVLERKIRAYHPWPGCFLEWKNQNLKILQAEISDTRKLQPSQRGIINKQPAIGTASMDLILKLVQMPGKKRISGSEFLNGARDWPEIS